MNSKTLLALSLVANVALAAAVVCPGKPRHLALGPTAATSPTVVPLAPQPGPGREPAADTPRAAVGEPFDWRRVESDDYRKYIANLRAIGCPEKTIRDIIVADVNELFRSRSRDLNSSTNRFAYWKAGNRANFPGEETVAKQQDLAREKRRLLKTLLGENYTDQADASAAHEIWDNQITQMLGFLAPEKQTAMIELGQTFGARLGKLDRLDADGMKELLAQQDAEALKILSPEEKFEYDLRMSRTATFMRAKMGAFEPTEQEFREMFRLQKQYDDQYGPAGYDNLRRSKGDPAQRASEKQLESQLRNLLGEDRFRQRQYEEWWVWDPLRTVATENNVPKETAFKVYDIQKEAQAQVARLWGDRSLSRERRDAARAAIRAETEKAVGQALGPVAGPAYVKQVRQGGWLQGL